MKIQFLSASAIGTGEWWRLRNMADSLRPFAETELAPALSFSLPCRMDHLISLPLYFVKVLFQRADVIIGNKPFINVLVPCLFARYVLKKTIVIDIDEPEYLYLRGIRSVIMAAVQKPFVRFFNLVTYHNDSLRELCIKDFRVPEQKMFQVKQGVRVQCFHPRPAKVKPGLLFFMGSLDLASNLASILRAVKMISEKHEISLIVAGGGPHESLLRKHAERLELPVSFTGRLSRDSLIEQLIYADVCLAYYEDIEVNRFRCSIKLREYLAMGKKVACNNLADMRQFAHVTYQSKSNIEAFASRIEEALGGGDGRERAGPAFIRKHANWDTIGERLFKHIQSIRSETRV